MCGFAGFISAGSNTTAADWQDVLTRMGEAIIHRGPDDSGIWTDTDAGIGLVHRRLSIVDLSPAGHQPMVSESGRYVIAFNGEIYNHLELRSRLDAASSRSDLPSEKAGNTGWRGRSDTETFLAGVEAWGMEATLKSCVGMFAMALWDREKRLLFLARDRMGEKPLYYGRQNGVLLFGSDLNALKVHQAFEGQVDREALTLQLRYSFIPAPYSIYKGIRKLPPGMWLTLSPGEEAPPPAPYWSFCDTVKRALASPFAGSDDEAVSALEEKLRESVALQMIADVPLGAFLSGGIDSSLIVALMQAQSSLPVRTFTIGFFEKEYDEAQQAKAVSRHLGTDHTELYVSESDILALIPKLSTIYSEPFSDSSQVPTFLVSEMTRRHVTVSLSGDAGDELFGGYSRYSMAERAWGYLSRVPRFLRTGLGAAIQAVPVNAWNGISPAISWMLPTTKRAGIVGDRLHKGAALLRSSGKEAFYRESFFAHWKAEELAAVREPPTSFTRDWPALRSYTEQMMAVDTVGYLPDDILVKVDRAAMAVSLETRVPLLDHRLVEFSWRLPLRLKVREGKSKWILRQVLYKYVPQDLVERPKMGFGIPIGAWLRGPLRDWVEELLDQRKLREQGFLNPSVIRRKWAEHLSGQRNWQYHLWDVLMFQAWLAERSKWN